MNLVGAACHPWRCDHLGTVTGVVLEIKDHGLKPLNPSL